MKKNLWVQKVLQALEGLSRTLGGVSDTSSSAEKPKLEVEGDTLATRTRENLEQALGFLWENREQSFASPLELREFIDSFAWRVNNCLLQQGQGLYRTWETKFRQTLPLQIEAEYQKFCQWLAKEMDNSDPVEIAALVEKKIDAEIHPFADGCGRAAKLLAAYVLLRHEKMPTAYRSRAEYYVAINKSDAEWVSYYRSL